MDVKGFVTKTELFGAVWSPKSINLKTPARFVRCVQDKFQNSIGTGKSHSVIVGELFENVDITTVKLALSQVMRPCPSVHLSVSDEATFQCMWTVNGIVYIYIPVGS